MFLLLDAFAGLVTYTTQSGCMLSQYEKSKLKIL